MFIIFGLIWGAVQVAATFIHAALKIVAAAVKYIVHQALHGLGLLPEKNSFWDLFLTRQIHWRKALTNQEKFDEEIERLQRELEDANSNGIPDLYDREVTSPEQDFLNIKYPQRFLKENDYVRYMPRRLGAIPQPVMRGAKGLVRSETINNTGAFVWIKWNALNPRGSAQAPLIMCNQMDLHYLGHVWDSHRVTQ